MTYPGHVWKPERMTTDATPESATSPAAACPRAAVSDQKPERCRSRPLAATGRARGTLRVVLMPGHALSPRFAINAPAIDLGTAALAIMHGVTIVAAESRGRNPRRLVLHALAGRASFGDRAR